MLISPFGEIVRSRAAGLCEYCLISEQFNLAPHEIGHVIALLKHGGQTAAENLTLSCTVSKRFKGSDIASIDPETGEVTALFHPRFERWHDHFRVSNGEILPLTAKARVTVLLLRMNRAARVKERQLIPP
jgi:hypothetical protein